MPLQNPDEKKRKRPDYPAAANSRPDMYDQVSMGGMADAVKSMFSPSAAAPAAPQQTGMLARPGDMASIQQQAAGYPVPAAPGKQGMTHQAPATDFMPQIPYPGFGSRERLVNPNQQPMQPAAGPGANDGVAEETAQPQTPAAPAPQVGENIPEDVMTVGSPYGMSGTLYANATPPKGSGNVIYSDSKAGATNVEGGGGFMRLLNPGRGPFGRTLENQAQIDQNVAAYQRTSNIYREQSDARKRDALERRASGDVSLNQSLGNFLGQSANRNYARKRLKEVEAGDVARDRTAVEAGTAQNKMALEIAKLNKPDYQAVEIPTGEADLYGKPVMREVLMDPVSGNQVDPLNPQGGQDSSAGNFDAARQAFQEQLKEAGGTREAADALLKRFTEEYQPSPAELAELKELIRGAK